MFANIRDFMITWTQDGLFHLQFFRDDRALRPFFFRLGRDGLCCNSFGTLFDSSAAFFFCFLLRGEGCGLSAAEAELLLLRRPRRCWGDPTVGDGVATADVEDVRWAGPGWFVSEGKDALAVAGAGTLGPDRRASANPSSVSTIAASPGRVRKDERRWWKSASGRWTVEGGQKLNHVVMSLKDAKYK